MRSQLRALDALCDSCARTEHANACAAGEDTRESVAAAVAAAAATQLGPEPADALEPPPSAAAPPPASPSPGPPLAPADARRADAQPASPAPAADAAALAAASAASTAASAELLFSAGSAALRGELALHDGEYELLAQLNGTAAGHYGNMADLAAGLGVFASALTAKDASFAPFLGIMDGIDAQARGVLFVCLTPRHRCIDAASPDTHAVCAQVGELETVVSTLDGYTRRLEARLKGLQERL